MTQQELLARRKNLLEDDKLKYRIAKMIRTKDLHAVLHSITTIAGRDGRSEIVIELFVDLINTFQVARVYLYLTEDIYDEDCFDFVDEAIGKNNLSIDDRILLRALRVVFTVIKNISTGYANSININKWIFVRTDQLGVCNYSN